MNKNKIFKIKKIKIKKNYKIKNLLPLSAEILLFGSRLTFLFYVIDFIFFYFLLSLYIIYFDYYFPTFFIVIIYLYNNAYLFKCTILFIFTNYGTI